MVAPRPASFRGAPGLNRWQRQRWVDTEADVPRGKTNTGSGPTAATTAQRWVLALASVASFLVILDMLVVATALTSIQRHLGASLAGLEWTINAYALSFAVLLLPGRRNHPVPPAPAHAAVTGAGRAGR